ncbi:hypothetical protein N7541_006319 [Penicillium brevicompactum]|uniref:Aminoglycoside phosphotransferase domain-containing protein n=1 Tax=Penicillium brevicompactum TaxID=5074 RepID=A0A9W9USE6_PENBR|nr:hypothetical protein N7541_006319 [Penicillium brevicompactum]
MLPCLNTEELSQRMRDLVFGGHLGPAQGKAITFDIVCEDAVSILFIAALISLTELITGLDRYLICLAKENGALLSTSPVSLDTGEMAKVFQESGCGKLVEYERFRDGSFGTTYKAKARGKNEDEPHEYIVQLRYHANIDNIYHLIKYVREKRPGGLPIPQMFPAHTSSSSVLGVQISQESEVMSNRWRVHLQIYGTCLLPGPETSLNQIPVEVENVELALVHTDLGLHNMIFSESSTPILKGLIDWEFVDYAPPTPNRHSDSYRAYIRVIRIGGR